MKRQPLDNGNWFDVDSAEKFEEDTWWNGNNHISRATGSLWLVKNNKEPHAACRTEFASLEL